MSFECPFQPKLVYNSYLKRESLSAGCILVLMLKDLLNK